MSNQQPISTFPGIAVAVVLCLTAAAHGGTIFVAPPPCGDDSQFGISTTCFNIDGPKATIQAAIIAAVDGDEVVVAQGEYFENINFNGKAITVRSTAPNDPAVVMATIINGGGSGHVVTCTNGEESGTVLSGFVITGGNATGVGEDGWGGGMSAPFTSPTVTNCSFIGNTGVVGGGWYSGFSSPSTPTVSNCTFSGNTADFGGGFASDVSSPTVTNCTFSGNTATVSGGGMWAIGGNLTVTNCTFSGNIASGGAVFEGGGGMYHNVNAGSVTNCTFSGNTATSNGGGMFIDSSQPTFTNCTFSGNTATNGGGIYNISNLPTFTNCTFSGNTATSQGGGLFNIFSISPTLTNCTFSGNTASSGGGMFNSGGLDPTLTNTGFCDNTPEPVVGIFINGGGNSLLYCAPPPLPKPDPCPTDTNDDGVTNVLDLVQLLLQFGQACP